MPRNDSHQLSAFSPAAVSTEYTVKNETIFGRSIVFIFLCNVMKIEATPFACL
jgi:hypothetical protein